MSKIDEILEQYKQNNFVYIDREGQHVMPLEGIENIPADEILQKVNRTEQVLLNLANKNPDNLKWVNDYALAKITQYLIKTINELTVSLDQMSVDYSNTISELEVLKQSTVSIELKGDVDKLQDENDLLKSKITELERLHQEALDNEYKATKKIEQLNMELENFQNDKDTLNAKYNELEERFNKSVTAYKELKNERDSINAKLVASSSESEQQYSELVKKYDELNEKYESLQAENAVVIDRHNETIKQDEYEIESLKTKLDALSTIETDYKELDAEYKKQEDLIANLEKEYNTTCEALHKMQEESDKKQSQINSLMVENGEYDEQCKNISIELDNVLNELNAYKASDAEKAEKINELINEQKALGKMANDISNIINNYTAKKSPTEHSSKRMGDTLVNNFNVL